MAESVPVDLIRREREAGWPTMHPEDYCHRCGARNMPWHVDRATWLTATSAWAAETGREGICCPQCFVEMYEAATGELTIWELRKVHPTSPDSGRDADQ